MIMLYNFQKNNSVAKIAVFFNYSIFHFFRENSVFYLWLKIAFGMNISHRGFGAGMANAIIVLQMALAMIMFVAKK